MSWRDRGGPKNADLYQTFCRDDDNVPLGMVLHFPGEEVTGAYVLVFDGLAAKLRAVGRFADAAAAKRAVEQALEDVR